MIWALASHYFPLAYLALGPALRVLDVRLEEAALVSGARYWQVMPKITLPLLRPAILSTTLLLFMLGMSSYEVPRLIGRPARIDVFTTEIQAATQNAPPEFGIVQRARHDAAVHLHRRRVLLPARDPQRRSLRHHHRQGLHADPHQAAANGAGRWRSACCSCSSWRSACRCSRWCGSRSSATWRSRSSARARPRPGRTTNSSCTIRSSSTR